MPENVEIGIAKTGKTGGNDGAALGTTPMVGMDGLRPFDGTTGQLGIASVGKGGGIELKLPGGTILNEGMEGGIEITDIETKL